MAKKKHHRPSLLSSTRPPRSKPTPSLSSRLTRTIVRCHHDLRKQLATAAARNDDEETQTILNKIEDLGGLSKYQQASIQGQSAQRGGDTSKVLVEWFHGSLEKSMAGFEDGRKARMLEIGALQTNNACSRSGLFEMERIDLHPQHPDITEQDFMQRPLPSGQDLDNDRFDIMSLSLVLNFVGDPAQRGEMLRRVAGFLRTPSSGKVNILPALFLVLPAPCVKNSRYMNEERLEAIMKALGYIRVMRKISSKLVYYLWKYEESAEEKLKEFKKQALRTGKSRNNFAIVLR